jgi:hypothetical protein
MDKPIRYSSEKKQELLSRSQLFERLVEFGWIASSPEDLGEDFIVHVYFQGRATGVSFYVQEKSVVNLQERQKNGHVPYDFKVKDLKHWSQFIQPVVLIVWDVKLREGRWVLLSEAIKYIEQKRSKWRKLQNTRLYIPWDNRTDNEGLLRLQRQIGNSMFPLIKKGKELNMTMSFEFGDSEKDQKEAASLQELIKKGGEVTLSGDVIKNIEIPDWARPWMNIEYKEIKIGNLVSKDSLLVDVIVMTSDGKTEIARGIQLKTVRSGLELTQLSNSHQTTSLRFDFTFSSNNSMQSAASVQLMDMGSNVHVTRDILRFTEALSRGGKLQLFSIIHNEPLPIEIPVPAQPTMQPNPSYVQLVEHLCLIQDKTGKLLQMPSGGPTQQDLETIYQLVSIIKSGQVIVEYKTLIKNFEIDNPQTIIDSIKQNKSMSFTIIYEQSFAELFGQRIEMGKMSQLITGAIDMSLSELERELETYDNEVGASVHLANGEIVSTYFDWKTHE